MKLYYMKKPTFPFFYGNEEFCINEESEFKPTSGSKKNQTKKLVALLLLCLLKGNRGAHGVPFEGVEAFTPNYPNYICRRRYSYPSAQNRLGIRIAQNQNPADIYGAGGKKNEVKVEYIPQFNATISDKQLQKKYKHAKEFGLLSDYNVQNRKLFKEKILEHMRKPDTQTIKGRYKEIPVTHYYNPETGLNALFMRNKESNSFISAWKLSKRQIEHLLDHGKLM
jgi:hypothetical protein